MREHVQICVGSGAERPFLQCRAASLADGGLRLGTMPQFATAIFRPCTVVLRAFALQFGQLLAFPFAEVALPHAGVGVHDQSERVGEGVRRGHGTTQVGCHDELPAFRVRFDV